MKTVQPTGCIFARCVAVGIRRPRRGRPAAGESVTWSLAWPPQPGNEWDRRPIHAKTSGDLTVKALAGQLSARVAHPSHNAGVEAESGVDLCGDAARDDLE